VKQELMQVRAQPGRMAGLQCSVSKAAVLCSKGCSVLLSGEREAQSRAGAHAGEGPGGQEGRKGCNPSL